MYVVRDTVKDGDAGGGGEEGGEVEVAGEEETHASRHYLSSTRAWES